VVAVNEFIGAKVKIQPVMLLISYFPGVTTTLPPGGTPVINVNFAYSEDVSSIGVPGERGYVYFIVAIDTDLALHAITYLNPLASGSYNVSSSDPLMEPQIVTNTLSDNDDRMSMRDNLRYFVANAISTNPIVHDIELGCADTCE
jgi:hypothetical protein